MLNNIKNHRVIKFQFIKGAFNAIILIIIFNILFLLLNILYHNIYIYKKIFTNEQLHYNSQIDLNFKLITAMKINPLQFPHIGFIPDNLNYLCPHGITIYAMQVNNNCYGYWGTRTYKSLNEQELPNQKLYYINLFKEQGVTAQQLNMIDLYNNNKVNQIFFMDTKAKLWSYDTTIKKFFPIYMENIAIKNYIIGNPIVNKSLYYNIYLHYHLNNQDMIKLIYFTTIQDIYINNFKSINLLTSDQAIHAIFLRANHLIMVSITSNPINPIINICKLNYNQPIKFHQTIHTTNYRDESVKNLSCNKLNVPLYKLPISAVANVNQSSNAALTNQNNIELIWNEEFNYHQINIYLNLYKYSYYFKLKEDNLLLSYKNIDN